ncbi:MAG: endonuclease/exonuclease/phosphatase family protein [Bacteroidales bacterium]|jgi:endonuclease/exonuclease/phosphatase family metal-dependent hydrolase|nr:endonuclease/exonuclease/phosphatase family protein [Bacteroidales bacterium]
MKRVLLFCVIILLVVASGCSDDLRKEALKVMTLNVRYDNPNDSTNAWSKRAAIVCNYIKAEKPDIFGLQEVIAHQYEYLDSVLTDYMSVAVGRSDGAREGEMNPVFFREERFDMTRTKTFWLSETPEVAGSMAWGAGLPRIVTWIELVEKESHQHIFFFNTHFAHDSDSARIMSSKLLLGMVDSIAAGFPFVITGDFNMTTDSKGYAILTGPAESVPLLQDSRLISVKNPGGPSGTFNGFSDKRRSGRIDYIFVKNGIKVLDQKTILRKERGIFISDHWPVEAIVLIE